MGPWMSSNFGISTRADLGLASRRLIAHRLRRRWSSLGGATVMGLGFATPYLDSWRAEATRSFGFMMARQGVIHWPQEGDSATALVDEFDLPLLESTVDFALIVHGLELTDNPGRNAARSLAGDGAARPADAGRAQSPRHVGADSIRHRSAMASPFRARNSASS